MTTSSTLALAQPATRDHRRRPPVPQAADNGPTEAPPAPRQEKVNPRPGFVWIPGHWEWRGKWEWVGGRWERERPNKRWREARWENQNGRWVFVAGEWVDVTPTPPPPPPPTTHRPPPPVNAPPGGWPTQAPPPPRAEKIGTRAGFVWIPGHWDWKNGKWEWVAGRWERERPGKRWRPVRWEQRDGHWHRIDGDWEDVAVTPPPPPPSKPGRPAKVWKVERPVVSSYWPVKGKEGSRVTIRGKNFPKTTQVVFAGQTVRGARVTDDKITFVIPKGSASGAIELRIDRRTLPVGAFEVAAAYDPIAEQKKLEEERRRQAEAAWAERQKQLAKERAEREAALRRLYEERAATREQRRAEAIAALKAKWQRAFLADPDTQDELTLHAQRTAELLRAKEVAELTNNGKLVVRIELALQREDQRHQHRMAALEASFKARGGMP